MKPEEFIIGEDLVIDVNPETRTIVIMGPDKKQDGAEPGSDEEYAHDIRDEITFEDDNLFQIFVSGVRLMEMSVSMHLGSMEE